MWFQQNQGRGLIDNATW